MEIQEQLVPLGPQAFQENEVSREFKEEMATQVVMATQEELAQME